jgi:hypothetical protein
MSESRRAVVWLVPILLTVHNAEEAIAFRSYLPRLSAILPPPFAAMEARLPYSTLLGALVVLSALAFLLAFAVDARPASRTLLWFLLALEVTMGLNGIAHLVGAAFLLRGYAPGLVTGLMINVPFAAYCFTRARRERWLTPRALWTTVPAALVLHGPVLLGGLWLASRS